MLQFSFIVPNMHLILSLICEGRSSKQAKWIQVWTLPPNLMKKKKKGEWNIMYEPISNENEEKQNEFQVWTMEIHEQGNVVKS